MNGFISSWRPWAYRVWTFAPTAKCCSALYYVQYIDMSPSRCVRLACSSRHFKLRWFPFGRERRSLNKGSFQAVQTDTASCVTKGVRRMGLHRRPQEVLSGFPFHRVADTHFRAKVLYGDVLRVVSDSSTRERATAPCTRQVRALSTKSPLAEFY